MTGLNTRFSVSLTKEEIQTILSCLRAGSMQPVTQLIERLERRLTRRDEELKELEELLDGPDYLVGI